ncbi:Predicted hydrolase [Vibrio owensii]|uniref:Predicted hydrolase n=1 Tax=Vibrio owensii TaxID=696485 RepID=A0AAU9QB07_9VIBR|nr:Predicted hydrolase [Vibrio owensii]
MLRKFSSNSAWLIAFFACFALYLSIACYPFLLSNNQAEPLTFLQEYYLLATQFGWLGLIALPLMLGCLLLSFLPTSMFKVVVITIAITLLIMLKVDILVFQQYKLHINGLLIRMFFEGGRDVFEISWMSWLIFISDIALLAIGLACTVWLANKLAQSRVKFVIVAVWFSLLLSTQVIHAYKNALYDDEVSQFSNNWPLYYPLTARKFIYRHHLVDENMASQNRVELKNIESSSLNYPLAPVNVKPKAKQPNVLFILVDAWRHSDATPEIMPNVSKFSEKTVNFSQHMSGGNSTQAGIFSLFYSLPATYWDSFYASQKSPVFMDTLQNQGYRMGIFGSAPLTSPPLSRTVFKKVKDLTLKQTGETQIKRDQQITDEFIQFQKQDSDKPYFSFLFYDSAHGTSFPEPEFAKFKPYWERVDHILLNNDFDASLYHNRYKNSLYFIDSLIAKVLKNVDLENTIVVITSDHGEEFNDHKMNYWGHTGNYSDTQVHVPLYVYLPDHQPEQINYRTTHYDIVPTLMNELFDVKSDTQSYSVGRDLFDNCVPRDWFIAGSYYNYALVGKETMLVVNPGGHSQQLNNQLKVDTEHQVPVNVIQDSLDEMSRFYKKG